MLEPSVHGGPGNFGNKRKRPRVNNEAARAVFGETEIGVE